MQHLGGRGLLLQRLARLGQQPSVLHRDHRLRGEVLEQCDFFVGERSRLASGYGNCPKQRLVFAQRNTQQGVDAGRDVCMPYGMVELRQIGDVDEGSAIELFLEERVVRTAGRLPQHARQWFPITTLHHRAPRLAVKDPQRPESGSAKLMRLLQDHLEDRGKVAG